MGTQQMRPWRRPVLARLATFDSVAAGIASGAESTDGIGTPASDPTS